MIARLSLPTCLVFALSALAPAADLDLTRAVVVRPGRWFLGTGSRSGPLPELQSL
jgi:hypothetical protein